LEHRLKRFAMDMVLIEFFMLTFEKRFGIEKCQKLLRESSN